MTRPVEIVECGTRRGYKQHRARGEEPCAACTQANRDYARDHWRRNYGRRGPLYDRIRQYLAVAMLPVALVPMRCTPERAAEPTPTDRFVARVAELGATAEEQARFRLVIHGPTARCRWGESNGDPNARLGRHRGLAQISSIHLPALGMQAADLFDPVRNAEAAMHVLRAQGWRAWSCAERAWGREGRA